jgi:glycosyltransferase involved in cell wall biosynthesis
MSQSAHLNLTPDLSIVLPALKATPEYLRCVYASRAALSGTVSYEIVSVVKDVETFAGLEAPDLRIIPEQGRGIYSAMNAGLDRARGKYIYFIGQDDILLPEAAEAFKQGLSMHADLILADVFWGNGRIYKNRRSPRRLIWKNWCHQGIMYRLEFVRNAKVRFPEMFVTQADHYANIVLTAGHGAKILKHDSCIAWYSASGVSMTVVDSAFRSRFPFLVREHFGYISYLSVVIRFALKDAYRKVSHR